MSGAEAGAAPDSSREVEPTLAARVVKKILDADAFGASLGVELVEAGAGAATVRMRVRPDMLNGFGVCHGGVTYSLADCALALAANTNGRVTLSIENGISYPAAAHVGDLLTARAEEESAGHRVAFYRVRVTDQRDRSVAIFRGTVYRTHQDHFPIDDEGR